MSSAPFVVIAEVRVRPEDFAAFLPLARRHAVNCRTNEPGCLQFDVTFQSLSRTAEIRSCQRAT